MSLIATKPVKPTTPPRVAPLPGFQLYFAGSLNKVFEEDLKRKGANRLASQLLDRNVIDGCIAGRNEGLSFLRSVMTEVKCTIKHLFL